MSNIENAQIIEEFKKIAISKFEDVLMALPALIPQTEEDKRLFRKGMTAIDHLVYDLKHSETPREIGRYLDVQKILQDFDQETIRTFGTKLSDSAKASIDQLSDIVNALRDEDGEYE